MYETKRIKEEKSKIENKTAYTHKQTNNETLLTAGDTAQGSQLGYLINTAVFLTPFPSRTYCGLEQGI